MDKKPELKTAIDYDISGDVGFATIKTGELGRLKKDYELAELKMIGPSKGLPVIKFRSDSNHIIVMENDSKNEVARQIRYTDIIKEKPFIKGVLNNYKGEKTLIVYTSQPF